MITSDKCIKQFIEDFSFNLTKSTLEGYVTAIRQLICFSQKPYNEITTRDIRNWILHLKEKDYKINSIKGKIFGLRLFYKYCLEEELITYNPVNGVPIPKRDDKLPNYLTYEQLMKLKHLCEGNLRQGAIIEVFYTTGVRLRELTSMKLEDINWSDRMIRIPKGKGKKERMVFFTKECEGKLKAYLNSRNDDLPFVFVNQFGTASVIPWIIQRWFINYRKKLGFYLSPHTLRHTFAAHLVKKGMSLSCIQVLLGHDHPSSTHIYTRLYQQAQKDKYDEWM
jgi:site-specific recombinase XerD